MYGAVHKVQVSVRLVTLESLYLIPAPPYRLSQILYPSSTFELKT